MKKSARRLLFWTPRVLCILFALFISLFALDVFGEGYGFWETLWALLVHLVPTFAWRWEWVGGILLIALGLFYIILAGSRVDWGATLLIAGPLFLVGVLFLFDSPSIPFPACSFPNPLLSASTSHPKT